MVKYGLVKGGVMWCGVPRGGTTFDVSRFATRQETAMRKIRIPRVILKMQRELVVKCKCSGMSRDQQSHCSLQLLGITG